MNASIRTSGRKIKILTAVLMTVLCFTMLFAPAPALGFTTCTNGTMVLDYEDCNNNNVFFFVCMAGVTTAATAAAAWLAWNPPVALLVFAGVFAAGAILCRSSNPPLPDLIASSMTVRGTIQQGNQVSFSGTVKNIDSKSYVRGSFKNRFEYRWGTKGAFTALGTVAVSPLDPRERSQTLVSSLLRIDRMSTLQVRICADSGRVITEANEANNCGSTTSFLVAGQPNLTAARPTLASGSTLQGATVTFRSVVQNSAVAATGRAFDNRFEYRWGAGGSWAAIGSVNSAALGVGANRALTSPSLNLDRSGVLHVRLCADSGDVVSESSESDNCSEYQEFATSGGLPNLVAAISPNPSSRVTEGTDITFTGTVRNSGATNAGASTAHFCVDNTNCATSASGIIGTEAPVGALAAGLTSSVISRTWRATGVGQHTVRLCADTGRAVAESNESDNCGSGSGSVITFTVERRPAGPDATLWRRNITPGFTTSYTTTSPFEIVAGHNIGLQWRGTNADSCRGVNLNTGGSTNDSTTDVIEPALGTSKDFEVVCSRAGVEDRATIRVTAVAALPTLEPSKNPVLTDEPFTLTWNLNGNDPAQCTITGPGSDEYDSAGSMTTQRGTTDEIDAVAGSARYTLDCPAGDDFVDVEVLPQVYES